ncbi:lysoplasmalogenase [Leifsonia sp. Leaf264]|uniref:lysoplasmalogenase n=1 Tax=Leifsonia sp. Leaf264 TaxID=1736314 RepID=UPI0009E93D0F|nr:lysoplasmalogenase [Leifsonia sp. Leaf264]
MTEPSATVRAAGPTSLGRFAALRPFVPYAAVAVVHIVALAAGWAELAHATKWILMPLLAVGFVLALRPRRGSGLGAAAVTTLVAIGLSWLGDVVIDVPGDSTFVLGLLAFLLAHLVYIGAFVGPLRLRRTPRWALVYAVWFVVFLLVLAPHLGALLVPVAVYGLVLGAMALTATRGGAVLASGGALFVLSDTLLALGRFLPGFDFPLKDAVIMTAYLGAQALIAIGVARLVRRSG